MKEITGISSEGIIYIDENDNEQFIDFAICSKNYVMNWADSVGFEDNEAQEEFSKRHKYVGFRVTFTSPAIVFYTNPRIRFEFPTVEKFYEVAYAIKKAGWRTNDGD